MNLSEIRLTLSSLSSTKLPLTKWLEYAKSMLFCMSIRKRAEIIDVCVKTSFYMRHKLLDCLKEYLGVGRVKGIVEVDETFHAVSYKGNHKKSGFALPRPARRRGKEVKGRVGISELDKLFEGRIEEGSILCTDSHKSYPRFAKEHNLDHKQIKRGRHKEGIYHINRLNALHSLYKDWIRQATFL